MTEYLKTQHFFDSQNSALVDLGYNGTMQKYLYQLSNKPLKGYYFITTDKTKEWESSQNQSFACFGNKIKPDGNAILKYSLFLEAWLTSKDGQLIKFENKASSEEIIPVFKPKEGSKQYFSINEEITKGVKAYIQDMLESLLTLDAFDLSVENLNQYYEAMVNNDVWDQFSRKIFHIEDDFCGNNKVDIIDLYKSRFVDFQR